MALLRCDNQRGHFEDIVRVVDGGSGVDQQPHYLNASGVCCSVERRKTAIVAAFDSGAVLHKDGNHVPMSRERGRKQRSFVRLVSRVWSDAFIQKLVYSLNVALTRGIMNLCAQAGRLR